MITKRIFDLIASLFGLVVLLPVLLVIAIIITTTMPGPVFFRQYRVSQDAKLVKMVKFRSMQVVHHGSSVSYSNEEELLALQEDPIAYNNEVIFPDKVRINLKYLEKQSLWLDLRIIVCTVFNWELKGF